MNSYERVLTVLRGAIPDRVPTFELMVDPKVISKIVPSGDYMDMCDALDLDIVMSQTPSKLYREEVVDEEKCIVRNEWGCLRQYNKELVSLPLHGPVVTLEDAVAYQAPDPLDDYRFEYLKKLVKRFKGKRFIGFHIHDGFNYSYYLSDMEDMMCNLIIEPEIIEITVKKAIEHNKKLAEKALDLGADFIISGDDYGSGTSLLASQEHFRKFFLPGLKEIAEMVESKGAFMLKHCCGNIEPIIPDMVGMGICAMHPLDEKCGLNQVDLKRQFPSLTVMGGVDCDEPLSYYSVKEMDIYIKKLLRTHAPGGRYICASSNSVHSSTKPENFVAMHEAVHKYGRYNMDGSLIMD